MDERKRRQARAKWHHTGAARPAFAVKPHPGQESVWDYPRPPRIEPDQRRVEVRLAGFPIAASTRAVRVLETASPPTFYLPPEDVRLERLEPVSAATFCEWKGRARYFDVVAGSARAERAAWTYPEPLEGFEELAGYLSFYPSLLACTVDGEPVTPQAGGFYGGWITAEIVGPFKGDPETAGW